MLYRFLYIPLLIAILAACGSARKAGGFDAQAVRPEIREMAETIQETGYIGTSAVSRNPEVSRDYLHRMAFINGATAAELKAFIHHDSGQLQAVAFEGLAAKQYPELKQVLLDLSESNRHIHYLHGDVEFVLPVVEYAYSVVLGLALPGEVPGYLNGNPTSEVQLAPAEAAFVENRILAVRGRIP